MQRVIGAGFLCVLSGLAAAADFRAGPDDYRELAKHLQAADRLLLEPGVYRHGLRLHDMSGTPGRPIVIEAAQPDAPPKFIARRGANTISLLNVRHIVIRHLELDGMNLPVDAVKAEGHSRYADFVTLEGLSIHDYAASQQNVGISTKCSARGWVIRNNRITRVGTGLYLGNSDGSAAFVGGLVEQNHVSDTLGYNAQFKHQLQQPESTQGRHDTVIRHNVFSKLTALPGPLARPNVLLGHFPLSGPGSDDRYLVYGNLFLGNPSEVLFQAEGRIAFYDNLLINAHGDAIHIQPHNDIPRDMVIFSNTIVASGTGIQIRQSERTAFRQRIVANLVAADTPISGGEATENVVLAYQRELAVLPVSVLSKRMRAIASVQQGISADYVREFSRYPDWLANTQAGTNPPADLFRIWGQSP